MTVSNHHYLVLTALGPDRIGILESFTKIAKQCGCNIIESKSNKIGSECVMLFHLSGTWSAIAKIEAALPAFAEDENLEIQLKRTTCRKNEPAMPYQVQVSSQDRPGIVNELALFFSQQGISIDQMESETYLAKNQTAMASIQCLVEIPAKQNIASIRERFMLYCEDRNLDAMIEPHKQVN